jgi:hypothetical protein
LTSGGDRRLFFFVDFLVFGVVGVESGFVATSFFICSTCPFAGSRHQTPDTVDERVSDLPPRHFGGPRGRGGRRDNRRDDRRRTTDDEETVLDSQEVSSVDRGEWRHLAVARCRKTGL